MKIRVSEAMRLFQLEHRLNQEATTTILLEKIPDVTTLKVSELLPEIPLEWRDSKAFFGEGDERYFFEEAQFAEAAASLWDFSIKKLLQVVHDDLSFWVLKLYQEHPEGYRELVHSSSWQEAYQLLQTTFKEFHPYRPETLVREEQEIYAVRISLLIRCIKENRFEALREEGKQRELKEIPLKEEVGEILDFLLALGEGEALVGEMEKWYIEENFALLEERIHEKEEELSPQISGITPRHLSSLEKDLFATDSQSLKVQGSKESKGEKLFARLPPPEKIKERAKKIEVLSKKIMGKVPESYQQKEKAFFGRLKKTKAFQFVHQTFSQYSAVYGAIQGAIGIFRDFRSLFGKRSKRSKSYQTASGDPRVLEGIRIIFEQLGALDEKVAALSENQQKLEERLIVITRKISSLEEKIYGVYALMHRELVLSRIGMSTLLDRSGKLCRAARVQMHEHEGYRPHYNRFVSFAAFQNFCLKERYLLQGGLNGLPELLMRPGEEDGALIVEGRTDQWVGPFFEYYQTLWAFLKKEGSWKDGMQMMEFFLAMPRTISSLEHGIEDYQTKKSPSLPPWMKERLGNVSLDRLLGVPYAIERLLDYSESAYAFHYFYELFENFPGGNTLSIQELEKHQPNPVGHRLLQDAFIRLEIGIFQLNLISGMGLLPLLFKTFERGKEGTREVFSLLAGNKILARNFMIYAFRKRIESKKRPLTDYYFSYSTVSLKNSLQNLLGDEWNFIWDEEEYLWKVTFHEQFDHQVLPTPTEIIRGELSNHPQLGQLYFLRKKILREMAGYQIKENPEGGSMQLYQAGVLLNSIFFRSIINQQQKESHDNSNRKAIEARL